MRERGVKDDSESFVLKKLKNGEVAINRDGEGCGELVVTGRRSGV